MTGNCTHLSLYTEDALATKIFYTDYFRCTLIRLAEDEGTVVIDMGDFRLVFSRPKEKGSKVKVAARAAISHIGYEFPQRADVEALFARLKNSPFADSVTTTKESLANSPATGPFRFYATDPNGYCVEVHSWEGCDSE